METTLSQEIFSLLNDDATIKVLATVDDHGVPHVVSRQSLRAGDDGLIHCLDFNDCSTTGRNLVRSIWYNRQLAIGLKGADGRSVQIKGRAVKVHITGPLFQQHYVQARAQCGDVDLSGVWIVEPDQVIDHGVDHYLDSQGEAASNLVHLDRIAITEPKA